MLKQSGSSLFLYWLFIVKNTQAVLWTFFILIIFVGLGPTYCEGGATLSEDPLYEDFEKMLSGDMSITRER